MTENRKPRPKEKKSEMLDVRLPFGLKQALVEACRKQGVTVSDTVRGLISEYVNATKAGQTHPKLRGIAMKIARNPLKTTGMALTSLAAFALTAAPSTADERLFKALDLDGDGTISAHDLNETDQIVIQVLDADHSETVTLDEFRLITQFGRFTMGGPVKIEATTVTVNEDRTQATYGGRVDLNLEPQNDGFELRLPDTETWSQEELGLQHLAEGQTEGSVDISFPDIHHASIVTLDLSEAGQVKLTSERVAWEDFDAEGLGLVIVDNPPDETDAPNPPR